jgi:leader peptidase (prepilin peptidase)/N-methyltransferase
MPVFEYLQETPAAYYTLMGVLGLIIGSFLNVVIHRLPKMLQQNWERECRIILATPAAAGEINETYNLIRPRSRCPHCQRMIRATENIPILSYILLHGRCSGCGKPISIRYPLVEALSGGIALLLAWYFGFTVQAVLALVLSWALLALSIIDLDHQLLPDDITLSLLWTGLLVNLFGVFTDTESSLIGAMAGYGVLWSVFILFRLVTGKEGMGYGDFKLLAALGAWLGWQMLSQIIILASLCGALVGLMLILLRRHAMSRPLPFGPYLAAAGWLALILGRDLNALYVQWAWTP